MFLFRMHSVGSVRPVPRTSAMVNQWWGGNPVSQLPEATQEQAKEEPAPKKEAEEDVVVMIQEEEMVLVRKELQEAPVQEAPVQEAPVQEVPRPECIEPECTVSRPKPKKKHQKRK